MNRCPTCLGRFPDDEPSAPVCACGIWITPREDNAMYPTETTASLIKMREEWLRIVAIPSKHGGFDVAVVIDGTYSSTGYDPVEVVKGWVGRIEDALAADGLPLGVPLSKCDGRAKVLGEEDAA